MGLGPLQERGAAAAVDLILMGGLEESGQLGGAVATVVRSVSDQEEGPPVQCIMHAWSTCKKIASGIWTELSLSLKISMAAYLLLLLHILSRNDLV